MSRYALVVGVGEYKDPRLRNLERAKADAQGIYDLLAAQGDFDELHLLQDEQASYRLLCEKLEYVLLKQGAKAEVLIYFSGHGLTAGPSRFEQQGHLATHDCVMKPRSDFWVADRSISFQFLNGLIAEADVAGLAVFLDCCHSELFIEQALFGQGLSSFGQRQYFLSVACRGYEYAYENKDEPYSAYTGALLQALGNETAGAVTVAEAHLAVRKQLKGKGQEPISLNYGSDFVVVDYRRQVPTVQAVSEENPYQGLQAFTLETEQFFFGRDEDLQTLLRKLEVSNFVPVLGPSGSGKSSVVRAKLVKSLTAQGWSVMTMKPGSAPMAFLEEEIRELLKAEGVAAGEQRALLRTLDTEGLTVMMQQMPGTDRVLLVVDQFEEVFTLCEAERQQRFVGELLKVREAATSRLAVVVTMRSDFVNEWMALGYPTAVVNRDLVGIGPLKGENLRDAIVKPAQQQGYTFGEGLLELLLADVDAENNCLPLLEFVLTELWEKRDAQARKLTAAAYQGMGRLKGALNKRAEEVYGSLREEIDRPWARRVCLRLVRLGKGEKDTRQRLKREALLAMGGAVESKNGQKQQTREIIDDVINSLITGRLLVADGEFVDLAHEALLDGWQRYAQWRQEDRDLRRLVQRLEDEYEGWKRAKVCETRDEDAYLMKGGLLAEVREQKAVINEVLADKRPELMRYFFLSVEREQQTVAALEQALAKADIHEASRKIRDRLLSDPSQTVDAVLSAVALVGKSKQAFQCSKVVYPVQDALCRAQCSVHERIKVEGHSDWVWSVACNKKGTRIISGSDDNTLRLWDWTGNPIGKPFVGHDRFIWSVAFNDEGNRVISGSDDNTLRLWDLEGNSIGQPFIGHTNSVTSVAFSPKGNCIVSGSFDFTIRLWDLDGRPIEKPFIGHSGWIRTVAFSPDGKLIASGSDDGTLRLWDTKGNAVGSPFISNAGIVASVAFNRSGDLIVSSSADNTLRLWNLEGRLVCEPFSGHTAPVTSVAFSPEGDRIISGSEDWTLRLWDLKGNPIGEPLVGHEGRVSSVAFCQKAETVVSGGVDNTLRIWNLSDSHLSKSLLGHSNSVYSVAYSCTSDRIVSGSADGSLRSWKSDGTPVDIPFTGHKRAVKSVAFSPQGELIVSGSDDHTVRLWDLNGKTLSVSGEPFNGSFHDVFAVAFHPKNDYVIAAGIKSTLHLWDLKGKYMRERSVGHSDCVYSVAVNSQGTHVVSGSFDNTLRLWNLTKDNVSQPFVGHDSWVLSVAFNPEGNLIVSGSADNTLRLWDLDGNSIGEPFIGHSDSVNSVAFHPEGDLIVSGSEDSTLRLWDLGGNPIGKPFTGHSGTVYSVSFNLRGDKIVSGSSDHTLRIWRGGTWQDWLRQCCSRLMQHTALVLPKDETALKACEVCEKVWTPQQSAQFAVAQGSALARRGDVEGAITKYHRAKELDPTLTIDPVVRANELAEWSKT